MNKKLIGFFFSLFCLSALAQSNADNNETLATTMRSNGKIYVVVAVMLTILTGLIIFLIRIDRKISKLENEE